MSSSREKRIQLDKEYLEWCLSHDTWTDSRATVAQVARILQYWGCFRTTDHLISFFQSPWSYKEDMQFTVRETLSETLLVP